MKPKKNRGYQVGYDLKGGHDQCQTPPYAIEPLLPYIPYHNPVWECAAGEGILVREMEKRGYTVISTELRNSDHEDFLTMWNDIPYNCTIVTNPPYSLKYKWLERCYELTFPFALLMPVEMIGAKKAQDLFKHYGIEIIFMSPRVDFYMPEKGWKGGGAQFPTAWYTWKLNLPKEINFATLNKPKRSELEEYWKKALGE